MHVKAKTIEKRIHSNEYVLLLYITGKLQEERRLETFFLVDWMLLWRLKLIIQGAQTDARQVATSYGIVSLYRLCFHISFGSLRLLKCCTIRSFDPPGAQTPCDCHALS